MATPTCPCELNLDILLSDLRHLRAEVAELRRNRPAGPMLTVEQAGELLGCQRGRVFELLADPLLRNTTSSLNDLGVANEHRTQRLWIPPLRCAGAIDVGQTQPG